MEAWRAKLAAGDSAGAWELFIARYRRLILAVITRTLGDDDDVEDVFSEVSADLSQNDLELLARHTDSGKATFSTWLVTVVHHRAIDWVRHRDGRRRVAAPPGLSAMQQQIFNRIVCERHSQVEAYEIISQRGSQITFGDFMREVRQTFSVLGQNGGQTVARYFPGPPSAIGEADRDPHDTMLSAESDARVTRALGVLPPDERLAVKLFVIDELSAAAVAKALGWPNSKAVYNRVYRALAVVRSELERLGIERVGVE